MTHIDESVVLVDPAGNPLGTELKSVVHTFDTPLHLAFSLYLFNEDGQLLMTRRSLNKLTWAGVWTNSCCGHPLPEESFTDAIHRRLLQELGTTAFDIRCVLPDFAYTARDASGIRENEICPVYVGTIAPDATIAANPNEVMDYEWASWPAICAATAATPFAFSPWSVRQVAELSASGQQVQGQQVQGQQ
ncbi:isopentenyl-diphosphate Delta-isomerase [Nakamurella antarctica]|uniref:Isopentenyl-diphosphate Delta-isomerase n=1 Tax=Nakamurella antarctica TaxID=1902245 RepID=A0A3G8ZP89_9ACTN|nr:isopentenyl-diphosphate Delta-isomerase [Nakamurella antarctica]AZI59162.1 isopentenyl-diphosphate Delta-isomerase [Nakamurella antarctica]